MFAENFCWKGVRVRLCIAIVLGLVWLGLAACGGEGKVEGPSPEDQHQAWEASENAFREKADAMKKELDVARNKMAELETDAVRLRVAGEDEKVIAEHDQKLADHTARLEQLTDTYIEFTSNLNITIGVD